MSLGPNAGETVTDVSPNTNSSTTGSPLRQSSPSLGYERAFTGDTNIHTWTSAKSGSSTGVASSKTSIDGLRIALASKLEGLEKILPATVSKSLSTLVWNDGASRLNGRPWSPTIIRFGPLSGIFCMLLAFGSIVASLGVLVGSDGSPVLHWSAPPPTYLAICTAIVNLAMRYACIQGVVIAWWCKALRGSSFKQLHYDYRAGTTVGGALTAGRYTGLLGLACIASTLVIIDGPLLQRASKVRSAPIDQPLPLNVTMVPQIPTAYTGWWQTAENAGTGLNFSTAFNATIPAPNGKVSNRIYASVVQDLQTRLTKAWFFQKEPLKGVFQGCSGQCTAKLIAPALATTSCSSQQLPIDLHGKPPAGVGGYGVPAFTDDSFVIGVELVVDGEQEKINLVTAYSTLEDCRGMRNVTSCTLESAVGEYSVSIYNNTATVDPSSAISPRILALSNNAYIIPSAISTSSISDAHYSTLAGIVAMSWAKWDSYNAVWKDRAGPYNWAVDGGAVYTYQQQARPGQCASFSDPNADMLSELNMLMVYTGMFASEESDGFLRALMERKWADSVNTTITGRETGQHSVFHTNFNYFIAAAVLEIVCIALIAPTYWGWWRLGRHVSFSPLEVAKAFGSPLLSEYNSNTTGRDIASLTGDSPIRYGAEKDVGGEKTRLTFADADSIELPQKGERFEV